jgi:hypothetical protein
MTGAPTISPENRGHHRRVPQKHANGRVKRDGYRGGARRMSCEVGAVGVARARVGGAEDDGATPDAVVSALAAAAPLGGGIAHLHAPFLDGDARHALGARHDEPRAHVDDVDAPRVHDEGARRDVDHVELGAAGFQRDLHFAPVEALEPHPPAFAQSDVRAVGQRHRAAVVVLDHLRAAVHLGLAREEQGDRGGGRGDEGDGEEPKPAVRRRPGVARPEPADAGLHAVREARDPRLVDLGLHVRGELARRGEPRRSVRASAPAGHAAKAPRGRGRNPEVLGDLLVRHSLDEPQDERDPLARGHRLDRPVNRTELGADVRRRLGRHEARGFDRLGAAGEADPAHQRAAAHERVSRAHDGPAQPTGERLGLGERVQRREHVDEGLLRDLVRLGGPAEQPVREAEDGAGVPAAQRLARRALPGPRRDDQRRVRRRARLLARRRQHAEVGARATVGVRHLPQGTSNPSARLRRAQPMHVPLGILVEAHDDRTE